MSLVRRFLNVFRRAKLDRDLEDELEFHRQMRLRKALDQGLNHASAEEAANRRMGNLGLAREEMRDARIIGWLASSLQDLRHGVVLLNRDAGLSALMILVLAIGIGGSATMFTLLKAAFLDPLPYRDPDRLVTIIEDGGWNPSLSEYLELRSRSRTLEQVAFTEHRDMQVSGGTEPVRVFAARVTASFFPLLGSAQQWAGHSLKRTINPGAHPLWFLRIHSGAQGWERPLTLWDEHFDLMVRVRV
jgi:putative ABC transport system permease protein